MPRRLWGVALVVLAAVSMIGGGPLTAAWPAVWRVLLNLGLAVTWLVFYVLLSPATLSYTVLLDLRRRGRSWLEHWHSGRLAVLHDRTRWLDLVVPLLLTLLLLAAVWTALDAAAAAAELTATARHSPAPLLAAVAILVALPLLGVALPSRLTQVTSHRFERCIDGLVAGAVGLLRPLLAPLVWLGERWLGGVQPEEADAGLPEEDLADVIEVGSHQGDLTIAQSELLRRELEFVQKTAAEVMVPRVRVQYLDIDQPLEAVRELMVASRHSRFPVQEGSVDHVVALLHAKQLLNLPAAGGPTTVRDLLARSPRRPPLHVTMEQPLEDVLEALRRAKASLAIVDDAYGGVAGILTVEDVVEELVGEIVDESDTEVVRETFQVSGRRALAELAEHGVSLPGEAEETVAEFLHRQLTDRVQAGEEWAGAGCRLVVEEVDAHGEVEQVRVEVEPRRAGGEAR
ncbi:MAG: CBS domain-containing protein [Fimbriimonadaceae bacterium]|nr:CBS domain-containing protein [Fimbriimonadaceae bacterium]